MSDPLQESPPSSPESLDNGPSGRGFTVRDRRWWADGAEPGTADGQPESRKPSYVEQLEAELADARRAVAAMRADKRAALDELERAKQRIEREAARNAEQRLRDALASLLGVLDDLDRALESSAAQPGSILDGVSLVRRNFLAKLAELGVTPMEAEGAAFDPARHEAVAMVEVDDPTSDGAVVTVHRPGYQLGEHVLRPAMVAVGKRAAGTG